MTTAQIIPFPSHRAKRPTPSERLDDLASRIAITISELPDADHDTEELQLLRRIDRRLEQMDDFLAQQPWR